MDFGYQIITKKTLEENYKEIVILKNKKIMYIIFNKNYRL